MSEPDPHPPQTAPAGTENIYPRLPLPLDPPQHPNYFYDSDDDDVKSEVIIVTTVPQAAAAPGVPAPGATASAAPAPTAAGGAADGASTSGATPGAVPSGAVPSGATVGATASASTAPQPQTTAPRPAAQGAASGPTASAASGAPGPSASGTPATPGATASGATAPGAPSTTPSPGAPQPTPVFQRMPPLMNRFVGPANILPDPLRPSPITRRLGAGLDSITTTGEMTWNTTLKNYPDAKLRIYGRDGYQPMSIPPSRADMAMFQRVCSDVNPKIRLTGSGFDTTSTTTWVLPAAYFTLSNPAWEAYVHKYVVSRAFKKLGIPRGEARLEHLKLYTVGSSRSTKTLTSNAFGRIVLEEEEEEEEATHLRRNKRARRSRRQPDREPLPPPPPETPPGPPSRFDFPVGTLTVFLPLQHEGGRLDFCYRRNRWTPVHETCTYTVNTDEGRPYQELKAVAWLHDVQNVTQPLVAGNRLVVTYRLAMEHGPERIPTTCIYDRQTANIRDLLHIWHRSYPPIRRGYYDLGKLRDGQISRALTLGALVGRSHWVCRVAQKTASDAGLLCFLAQVYHVRTTEQRVGEATRDASYITHMFTMDGVQVAQGIPLHHRTMPFVQVVNADEARYIFQGAPEFYSVALVFWEKENMDKLALLSRQIMPNGLIDSVMEDVAEQQERSRSLGHVSSSVQVNRPLLKSLDNLLIMLSSYPGPALHRVVELSAEWSLHELYYESLLLGMGEQCVRETVACYAEEAFDQHIKAGQDPFQFNWYRWLTGVFDDTRSLKWMQDVMADFETEVGELCRRSVHEYMTSAMAIIHEHRRTYFLVDAPVLVDLITEHHQDFDWVTKHILEHLIRYAPCDFIILFLEKIYGLDDAAYPNIRQQTYHYFVTYGAGLLTMEHTEIVVTSHPNSQQSDAENQEPVRDPFLMILDNCRSLGLVDDAQLLLNALHEYQRTGASPRAGDQSIYTVSKIVRMLERNAQAGRTSAVNLISVLLQGTLRFRPVPRVLLDWTLSPQGSCATACQMCSRVEDFLRSPYGRRVHVILPYILVDHLRTRVEAAGVAGLRMEDLTATNEPPLHPMMRHYKLTKNVARQYTTDAFLLSNTTGILRENQYIQLRHESSHAVTLLGPDVNDELILIETHRESEPRPYVRSRVRRKSRLERRLEEKMREDLEKRRQKQEERQERESLHYWRQLHT